MRYCEKKRRNVGILANLLKWNISYVKLFEEIDKIFAPKTSIKYLKKSN